MLQEKQKMVVDKYIANGYNLRQAYEEVYGKKDNKAISYPYKMMVLLELQAMTKMFTSRH